MKRAVIVGMFFCVFLLALWWVFVLSGKKVVNVEQNLPVSEQQIISDSVHTYMAADVKSGCSTDDGIFCAVELAVKCTLAPELDGCVKGRVPSFILAKPDVTERPTEMSFSLKKIKPIAESGEMFVYTKSTCDKVWFGLCEGTVVYSLTAQDGAWVVTNVYALED